ncbi:hypothetical protein C8P66_10811 [Humitalea rosea]|uniref:Uncharacterized protein n=1 Tax=Humitalea rosea TaxID=990373 RepID=A0A2W7J6B1_9PROT|nr:DUF6476 family protein [Humitalea rosea]PZW46732.1 hypothetical protein C8P66_10811 [Humitalea rosea]
MGALKILVTVMGVLIVAGTVTLVVLLVQRAGGGAEAPRMATSLGQPAGTTIGGMAAAEGRIAVWVHRPDGDRVLLLDPRRGTIAGEVRLAD